MNPKIWAISEDGTIEFISITAEYLKGALELARQALYPHEVTCVALGVPKCEGSMNELDQFIIKTVKDGVSIIAVEKKTKRVIGAAFNKIQRNDSGESFFEDFAASCKYDGSKNILKFMIFADEQCNLFEHCKIECSLELALLTTSPEFTKKGIAKTLTEISIEVATKLCRGINVKVPLDGSEELILDCKPKIISAIFTSPYSKKIGRSLGWEIAAIVETNKFVVNGKALTNMEDCTLEFKRLE